MTDTNHLKPCPFCGSIPTWRMIANVVRIHCPKCVSVGFSEHERFGDLADEKWNNRIAEVKSEASDD